MSSSSTALSVHSTSAREKVQTQNSQLFQWADLAGIGVNATVYTSCACYCPSPFVRFECIAFYPPCVNKTRHYGQTLSR